MNTRQQDSDSLKRLAADWRRGWLSGDADLLISLWARDGVLLPQDSPAIVGIDAIAPIYRSILAQYSFESESKILEVEACGELGYIFSAYTLTATPKSGEAPVRSSGKSIFIVKRNPAGEWKISRLIDNSDGEGC